MKLGVFDSGVGGLTVLKEVKRAFPNVDIIYLGDTARVPYGGKSRDTIIRYSLECAQFLMRFDIDLLIVACNTASSYALDILKDEFGIPIFGVIDPGVKKSLRSVKDQDHRCNRNKKHHSKRRVSKKTCASGKCGLCKSLPSLCAFGRGRDNGWRDSGQSG